MNDSPSLCNKREVVDIIKDKEFFKMLHCCGVITEYGLQIMKISKYKLKMYKQNNLINIVYENGVKGYKLTMKAKKIISKLYGLERSYTYRSIRHCSKLQEIYLNINTERYKWITENEAIDLLKSKIKLCDNHYNGINLTYLSPVDAIILDRKTGVLYGIEIVSQSYRKKDLNKKQQFLKVLNIEGIFIDC